LACSNVSGSAVKDIQAPWRKFDAAIGWCGRLLLKFSKVDTVAEDKDIFVEEAAVPVERASTFKPAPQDLEKSDGKLDRQKDALDELKLVS